MEYKKLINIIEEIAPPHLAESWDNSGVQIYTGKKNISAVLVCLEINRDVIAEAERRGMDMIVSHHPLIFGGTDCIDAGDGQTGEYITRLIRSDICVYSAHLSFDNAPLGNNYYMAQLLQLTNTARPMDNEDGIPGLTGDLPLPMDLDEACAHVTKALKLPDCYIRTVGDPGAILKKVGLCTGGGGEFLDIAIKEGCDLFITGDVKFHEAQKAKAKGIALIDAGHYGTEKIFAENFADQLRARASDGIIIEETSANTNPYVV